MVYVGTGMDPDSFADVEGKIVLVDLIAPGLTYDGVFEPLSLFTYDPDDTLPGAKVTQNWPVFNILSSYQMAVENGAVGFIGILGFDLADTDEYFSPYNAVLGEIPGVYVSKSEGDYLKELLEENDYVDANIVLRGKAKEGLTYNVIGWIPGESDEVILVTSHYDGWAVNDASGTSIVMALAKYFGQFRTPVTKRSLLFIASAGHFIGDIPTRTFIEENPDLVSRIVVDLNVEHIAKEIVGKDGMLVPTGLVAPRAFFISGPSKGGNPYLTQIASDAVERYRLKRTVAVPADLLGPHPPGIAHWYHQAGVPVLDFISGPAIMFTPMDKPNKVAVSQLRPVTAAFIKMIKDLDDIPADWLKGEGPSEESE
ncbi:MAG: hypothetical protein DRH12_10420 [Deltaproteobacteria bacterium]|nr:MAG: hypothetical protein DRH12_10420 [Deltaproteobacteria bacterium]